MNNIYYSIHLLLNSKYRLFINLFIVSILYFSFYGGNILYCMNDNPDTVDIPSVAEAKEVYRPTQQMLAIKREIMTYAGSHAHYLERINELEQTVAEQKTQIEELTTAIEGTKRRIFDYYRQGNPTYRNISEGGYKNEIRTLQQSIDGYKRLISTRDQELLKANAVIDEYRHHIYKK